LLVKDISSYAQRPENDIPDHTQVNMHAKFQSSNSTVIVYYFLEQNSSDLNAVNQ